MLPPARPEDSIAPSASEDAVNWPNPEDAPVTSAIFGDDMVSSRPPRWFGAA